MISETQSRANFIGGSESHYIYMNYNTKTFKNWWKNKLERVNEPTFSTPSMAVGTILEDDVLDLYETIHKVKGDRGLSKVKGIARANTDYILGDKVADVKVSKKAFEWFLTEKIPKRYKCQLIHYCYVFDLRKASIIAYPSDKVINNPFEQLEENKVFEIPLIINTFEISNHEKKLQYLDFCRDANIYPGEELE